MKFKYLIIIFCIIIVMIISLTALLPVLLTGPQTVEGVADLRYITLPFLLIMVLLFAGVNVFFILNYRLFSLLEREDWPALAYYLENKVYVKRRYTARNIRLLATSYMLISDYQSVLKLESKTQLAKPSLITKNVLIFGSARILSGVFSEAAVFFGTQMRKCKADVFQWVRWFYGFSLLLKGSFDIAEPEFISLALSSDNALITGLSAYFLNTSLEKKSKTPEKCREASEDGKKRVVTALKNAAGWNKEMQRAGTEIHFAIIKKYIDETGKWLFG